MIVAEKAFNGKECAEEKQMKVEMNGGKAGERTEATDS